MRLEKWIQEKYPTLTRSQVHEALEKRWVTLNGKGAKKGSHLEGSEGIDLSELDKRLSSLRKGNPSLVIPIIEDKSDFWVVNKPVGIPSHPLHLEDTHTVTQWAFAQNENTQAEFPHIQPTLTPHRLDTATRGLLIVAKTGKAFFQWRSYFRSKKIKKEYLAWCWGVPSFFERQIDSPLMHDPKDSRRMVVAEGMGCRQFEARSTVKLIDRKSDFSLVKVDCFTGVTHQVRAHLSSIGLPLVGDKLYDPEFENRRYQTLGHWLLASKLETPEGIFSLASDTFLELISSL